MRNISIYFLGFYCFYCSRPRLFSLSLFFSFLPLATVSTQLNSTRLFFLPPSSFFSTFRPPFFVLHLLCIFIFRVARSSSSVWALACLPCAASPTWPDMAHVYIYNLYEHITFVVGRMKIHNNTLKMLYLLINIYRLMLFVRLPSTRFFFHMLTFFPAIAGCLPAASHTTFHLRQPTPRSNVSPSCVNVNVLFLSHHSATLRLTTSNFTFFFKRALQLFALSYNQTSS